MEWGDGSLIWNTGPNLVARQTLIPVMRCPSSADEKSYTHVDSGNNNIGDRIAPCNYSVVASGTLGNPAVSGEETHNKHHFDDGGLTHSRYNAIFQQNIPRSFKDIFDGTSNTVAIGERFRNSLDDGTNNRYRQYFCIGSPNSQDEHASFQGSIGTQFNDETSTTYGYAGFSSAHDGGVQFLMADGAVRFISENIDNNTKKALGTRKGKEVVGEF